MIAFEIDNFFRKSGHWVDWDNTTDTFKAGSAQKEVKKIAVSWKANRIALAKAVEWQADLFITHESIAAAAVNGAIGPDEQFALESEMELFDWLNQTGLTVYRCHDFWDRYPEQGVCDTWGRKLFPSANLKIQKYPHNVFEIDPVPCGELAEQVLERILPLGQDSVQVTGNPETVISRVATGTGAACDPLMMRKLGAEAAVITDDYNLFVRTGEHLSDLNFPVIVVNHGVSEEWGIQNLSVFLEKQFPDIDILFIPHPCIFQTRYSIM